MKNAFFVIWAIFYLKINAIYTVLRVLIRMIQEEHVDNVMTLAKHVRVLRKISALLVLKTFQNSLVDFVLKSALLDQNLICLIISAFVMNLAKAVILIKLLKMLFAINVYTLEILSLVIDVLNLNSVLLHFMEILLQCPAVKLVQQVK